MKIAVLYAAMAGFDHGLSVITKKMNEVFEELGVSINETHLSFMQIPLYDGVQSKSVDQIVKGIQTSDGLILATTVQLFAPCAAMQTFLEHLEFPEYSEILKGKNCMLIALSRQSGEREAIEYLSKVVNHLGGYDSVRIAIGEKNQKRIGRDEEALKIIEKQVEDFYRMVRQDRQFFSSGDTSGGGALDAVLHRPQNTENIFHRSQNTIQDSFTEDEYETILRTDKRNKVNTGELQQKVNLNAFTKRQEDDINEITQFFASKYSAQVPTAEEFTQTKPPLHSFAPTAAQPIVARTKSCKQMSQSLPHYFQPHLAVGYNFTVQISISGAEIFDGYMAIENNECTYYEGVMQNPDITILTDATVWSDILRGKHTAQKAFMVGQLKVRGNFVMLSKFEQLFKKMQ